MSTGALSLYQDPFGTIYYALFHTLNCGSGIISDCSIKHLHTNHVILIQTLLKFDGEYQFWSSFRR